MKLVADENISPRMVTRLRQAGHIVEAIGEVHRGLSDNEVLSFTERGDAVLVTADRDFGELIFYQKRAPVGVILLRAVGLDSDSEADLLLAAIAQYEHDMRASFTVLSERAIRFRSLRGDAV